VKINLYIALYYVDTTAVMSGRFHRSFSLLAVLFLVYKLPLKLVIQLKVFLHQKLSSQHLYS